MDAQAFAEFGDEVFRLHRSGAYRQGLELATREGPRFPERAGRIPFWRACLAARLGDVTLALDVLDAALTAGFWFPEGVLREEEDLRPLQGLPAFERLVVRSRERQAAVAAEAQLDLIVLEPAARNDRAAPLLLALHGRNQTARDAAGAWQPAVLLGCRLALPTSGQPSWDVPDGRLRVWADREQAEREIRGHWDDLFRRNLIDPKRAVLAGFSAGGHLAVRLALSGVIPVGGFFVVAPSLLPGMLEELAPLVEQGAERGVRGYVVVGDRDRWSSEGSRDLAMLLRARGAVCEVETHPGLGHEFPPDFAPSLARGLGFLSEEP